MALLLAVFFVSIAVITLATLGTRLINQNRLVERYAGYESLVFGIESAFAQSIVDLEAGQTGMIGVVEVPGMTLEDGVPTFDSAGVSPVLMAGMPGLEYLAFDVDWTSDGVDNNGDGNVDEAGEKWMHTVYAAARLGDTVRRAEVVVGGQDVNVWRNAIFAGSGQAGGLINGNVSIHGSVHLLGDNLLAGSEAITALDLSGASLIHNNYEGLDPAVRARVPALPLRTFDGEFVEALGAELRVKHGLVGLSGNSEIGEPHALGNSFKETMDGTFVNDGWTGNAVIFDGDRGDPTSVFSDNGWDETYDLGDKVPFPVLTDDWRDPLDGHKEWDGSRSGWYSHEHYFDEVLVGDPLVVDDGIYNGNITIRCDQPFYYNASRPADPDPAHRLPTDDFILFDPSTNVLQINGQLTINGDLTLTRGGGNDKTIHYTGRAAILVHGNVTLDTDLYTVNSDGTTADSFPVNNCLGIMASQDMDVGTLSQLTLMGAFYAQGTITSEKQSTIMGTFVSNYFDMGTNVPDIYQVPDLADNLPLGMIGAYPILAFTQLSWRELT
jgi:hypothetical protein